MGCGMSRYGVVDIAACGYSSSSRKKLNESSSVDSSKSAKPILKKDGGDHDAGDAQSCRKSVSAPPPRKSVSTTLEDPCTTPKMTKDAHKDENEEDGGRLSSYDGPLWLNSPSFRDYCQTVAEDNLKDAGHIDSEKDESSSREALESKSSKKPKGSTLGRVFPNGSSMKQFLHISGGTKASGSNENHGKPVEKVD